MKEKKKKEEEYYGDPAQKFQGAGQYFRAKIIGNEKVNEARGDRLCQDTMFYLKSRVKAAGVHKAKVTINISLDGIKIIDILSGNILHHHSVHRISFISRDVTDARAFGYIYGPGDGTHVFFAIKTEKAAEPVVLCLRDLFLVVFEMKKKEVEAAKKNKEENKENHKEKEQEQKEETTPEFRNPPVEEVKDEGSLFDLEGGDFSNITTSNQGFVDMNFFGTAAAPPSTPGSATSDPFTNSSGSASNFNTQFPAAGAGGFNAAFPQQTSPPPNVPPRPAQMPGAFPAQPAGAGAWATFNTPSPQAGAFPQTSPPPAAAFPPTSSTTSPSNPFAAGSAFGGSAFGGTAAAPDPFAAGMMQPATGAASSQPQKSGSHGDMFSDLVGAFGTGLESKQAKPKDQMFAPEKDKTPMSHLAQAQQSEPPADDPFGMFSALGAAPAAAPAPATVSDSPAPADDADADDDVQVVEDPYDTSRPSTLPTNAPLAVNDAYLSSAETTPDQPPPSAPPPPLPTNHAPEEEAAPPPPPPRPASRASLSRPPSRQADSVAVVEFPVDFAAAASPSPQPEPPPCEAGDSQQKAAASNSPAPAATAADTAAASPWSESGVPKPAASDSPSSSPWSQSGVPKPSSNSPWPEEPIPEEFRSSPWPTEPDNNMQGGNNNMDKFETGAWPDSSPGNKAGKGKQLPPLLIPSPPIGSPKLSSRSCGSTPASPRLRGAQFSPRARPRPRVASTSSQDTPPLARQATVPNTPPLGRHITSSATGSPASTPPLPRKHGSSRAPSLSQRSMTLPAAAAAESASQRGGRGHKRNPSNTSITSTSSKDSTADPFAAVTLPRKRAVDSTIARARPRPRSKTPQQHPSSSSLLEPQRNGSPTSLASTDSQLPPRPTPATPVSVVSDSTTDPFAHVDPFAKEEGDPFEKDPFESPSDPFGGELEDKAEFKTKAVTTSNGSVSEDPFGGDPFAADPFADDAFSKAAEKTKDTNAPFDPFGLLNKPDANSSAEKSTSSTPPVTTKSNFSSNDPFRASNKSIDSLRFDAQRNADNRLSQRSTDSKVSVDSRHSQLSCDSKVSQGSTESHKSLQSTGSLSSLQSQSSRDSLPPPPLPQKKSQEQKISSAIPHGPSPKLPPRAVNTHSPKLVHTRRSSQESVSSRSSDIAPPKADSIKRQESTPSTRRTESPLRTVSETVTAKSDFANSKLKSDSKPNAGTQNSKANVAVSKADTQASKTKTDTVSAKPRTDGTPKKTVDPFGYVGTSAPVLGETDDADDPFCTDHIKSQFPGFGMSRAPLVRGGAVPKEPPPQPPSWAITIKTDVMVPPALPPAVPSRQSRSTAHTESAPALPARQLSSTSSATSAAVPPPPLPARQQSQKTQQVTASIQQQQPQPQPQQQQQHFQPKVSYPSAAPSPPHQVSYPGAMGYPVSNTPPTYATPPPTSQYGAAPQWPIQHERPPQYGEIPQQQPYGSPHQHAYAQHLAYQAYHHHQQQQQPHHGSPQQYYYPSPPQQQPQQQQQQPQQPTYDIPPSQSPYHGSPQIHNQQQFTFGSPGQSRAHYEYSQQMYKEQGYGADSAGQQAYQQQSQLVNGSSYYAVPPGATHPQPHLQQRASPGNPFVMQQQQQQQQQQQLQQHQATTHQWYQ